MLFIESHLLQTGDSILLAEIVGCFLWMGKGILLAEIVGCLLYTGNGILLAEILKVSCCRSIGSEWYTAGRNRGPLVAEREEYTACRNCAGSLYKGNSINFEGLLLQTENGMFTEIVGHLQTENGIHTVCRNCGPLADREQYTVCRNCGPLVTQMMNSCC